jgi:hypothetical protein
VLETKVDVNMEMAKELINQTNGKIEKMASEDINNMQKQIDDLIDDFEELGNDAEETKNNIVD